MTNFDTLNDIAVHFHERLKNKEYFRKILHDFMNNYRFNPELFPAAEEERL